MEFLTDLVADYPEIIALIGIAVGVIGLIVGIIGLVCIRSAKKLRYAIEDAPPPRRREEPRRPVEPRREQPSPQPEPSVMRERQISNTELRDMLHTANESAPVEIEISKYLTLTDEQKQGIFYVIIPDKG
jgi:hypothetical protein